MQAKKRLTRVVGLMVVLLVGSIEYAAAESENGLMANPPVENPQSGGFLSLRQALTIALKSHPALQEGEATLKAATARTGQVRSNYYPQIYANADTSAGAGRLNPRFLVGGFLVQQNLSHYVAGASVSQRVYDFGYTSSLVDSSHLAERAQGEDVSGRTAVTILNVQRSYYNSLKRRRLVQIAEETVRERGTIVFQIEQLYRKQLKSKLDVDLVQVELTNAQSLLVRARNDLKASFADLNQAMGIAGADDYVLDELSVAVRALQPMETLISESLSHPELRKAKELTASAEAKLKAMKRQYLPTVSAYASGGEFETFDPGRAANTGGWWAAGGFVSVPLFTGFMIENQVREAAAQQVAAEAVSMSVQQALTQQVTTTYLDTITLAQQIKLGEEQVKTAQEALRLAKQRYKLELGSIVEVTQSEVALTAAQTRLADAQYDYKISEVTLAYAAGLTGNVEPTSLYR